jgi:hypothetical protein
MLLTFELLLCTWFLFVTQTKLEAAVGVAAIGVSLYLSLHLRV